MNELLYLGLAAGGAIVVWWYLRTPTYEPTTGREQFEASRGIRDLRSSGDVPVDGIYKRDPEGAEKPTFKDDVSMMALGQTGQGKSTFVKLRLESWDFDGAVIAHALSEPNGHNEFAEFFGKRGQQVVLLSSRESTHRWDPMLDFAQTPRDMETLASGIFETRPVKETGWTEPARSMLVCVLIITSARYGDFARITDVLQRGPEWIVGEIEKVPGAQLVAAPIVQLDDGELGTIYTTLLNQIRPLLQSEVVNEDLPRLSLREYLGNPSGRTLVLDNIREDRYARGFWRFLLQSAVDLAFATGGNQQFLLDEFDKLPKIDNLDELASAGRSAGVIGCLVAQDIHQIQRIYGNMARSLWTNCPNRVCFKAGDRDTADLALSSLGVTEMKSQSVSDDPEADENEAVRISSTVEEKIPLLSGDLTKLSIGEAFIQTPHGWWVADLEEPDLTVTDPDWKQRIERPAVGGSELKPLEGDA